MHATEQRKGHLDGERLVQVVLDRSISRARYPKHGTAGARKGAEDGAMPVTALADVAEQGNCIDDIGERGEGHRAVFRDLSQNRSTHVLTPVTVQTPMA